MAHGKVGNKPFRKAIVFATEATEFDVFKNQDLLPLARDAGMRGLWLGIEDLTAGLVKKGQTVEKTKTLFKLLVKQGIAPMPIMMDHDGQPLWTWRGLYGLLNQVRFLWKAGAPTCQVTLLTPWVGSQGYEQPFRDGLVLSKAGGQPIEQYQFDGNHCLATSHAHPWRRQINMLLSYAAFYNPLNLLLALSRVDKVWADRVVFQLLGMVGLAKSIETHRPPHRGNRQAACAEGSRTDGGVSGAMQTTTPHPSSTTEIPAHGGVPRHVAIIMDGNGRWARQRRLPRIAGHKRGVEAVRATVKACAERGVGYLTLFAFSSENWRRPPDEVALLMQLFVAALENEVQKLHANGIRLKVIGERTRFDTKIQALIAEGERLTAANAGLTLTIAANYGGRWDVLQALSRLAREHPEAMLGPLREDALTPYLAMSYAPEPDLFIRTGGERRVSNFLLWQMAYTELHFTDTLWPDFDAAALDAAFAWYAHRERRFGRTASSWRRLRATRAGARRCPPPATPERLFLSASGHWLLRLFPLWPRLPPGKSVRGRPAA